MSFRLEGETGKPIAAAGGGVMAAIAHFGGVRAMLYFCPQGFQCRIVNRILLVNGWYCFVFRRFDRDLFFEWRYAVKEKG